MFPSVMAPVAIACTLPAGPNPLVALVLIVTFGKLITKGELAAFVIVKVALLGVAENGIFVGVKANPAISVRDLPTAAEDRSIVLAFPVLRMLPLARMVSV